MELPDDDLPQQGLNWSRTRLSGAGRYDAQQDLGLVPWTWGIPDLETQFNLYYEGLPLHESCGKLFGRVLVREGVSIEGFDDQLRDSVYETGPIRLDPLDEYLREFMDMRRRNDALLLNYGELVSRARAHPDTEWQCEPGSEVCNPHTLCRRNN